jgi:hypothetical protein
MKINMNEKIIIISTMKILHISIDYLFCHGKLETRVIESINTTVGHKKYIPKVRRQQERTSRSQGSTKTHERPNDVHEQKNIKTLDH